MAASPPAPVDALETNDAYPLVAGPRLLQSIALGNFLSFGPEMPCLPLGSLNVLVGPNGSGKSNLLEALSLLRSCVHRPAGSGREGNDLRSVIARGGGIDEWVWKGKPNGNVTLEATFTSPFDAVLPIRHVLSLRTKQQILQLVDERIENQRVLPGESEPHFYYQSRKGNPVVPTARGGVTKLRSILPDLSILAQLRDADRYPEISFVASAYEGIRIYREWSLGRNTVFREPQRADLRTDRLEEDFSNLGMFLGRLRRNNKVKSDLVAGLRDLYDGLTDFEITPESGTVQVSFMEGDFAIPATRLSDGSLRYLCLLAILCDAKPPPLICLEEPELGLHPDLLPNVADLLVAASQRTQLIVTTHSDILVDALTDHPDALVICEKHEGRTELRRLSPKEVQPWLEKYRLGQLWTQGQLGGTRW